MDSLPSPNVILIIIDDLGWKDVGYHGSEIKTPTIDRLAKEGVELNRFYVHPTCSPRDKLKFIHSTAQFTDFKTINGIVAPFNQYITRGTPEEEGAKFHENRYQWVQFGEERVERN